MNDNSNDADFAIEEAQAQLRESIDNAKKLVEQTRHLLNGEPEGEAFFHRALSRSS